jgi:hypothetical protein
MVMRTVFAVLAIIGLLFLLDQAFPGVLDDQCQRSEQMC